MQPDTLPIGARDDRVADAWRTSLTMLAAAVTALMLATVGSWAAMAHQWWNIDTYSHLLLVPFIIAWLVMLKREELARIVPQPFAPGIVAVAALLAAWGWGEARGINLIAQVGAVGAVQAAVVTVLGVRAGLLLWLPLVMGCFLVPFGDEIIPPLQAITADIAVALTRASGVPARIDGIDIHTPAGLFIVAEACSGVKFLIALVTLGVLVAFTRFKGWGRRALFMAACILVPILANGVRAWATIYVAQFIGADRATGFDHIVYGWVFFALIVAAVLAGAWRYFEREPQDYGWRAAELHHSGWLARAEIFTLPPALVAAGIAAMAAIAAFAAMR